MATQKGRNWSSGDIVTAANLSSIERGVSAVSSLYEPTTWANGDIVTAAALNNIEQGIVNADGGGETWVTLCEEEVTTVEDNDTYGALLSYSQLISADTIRVTFDETIYMCDINNIKGLYIYGGFSQAGPDFSEYPFVIISTSQAEGDVNRIMTETSGTHTVKIEVLQESGSSDFSTAEVTVVNNSSSLEWTCVIVYTEPHNLILADYGEPMSGTYRMPLYKGSLILSSNGLGDVSVSGACEYADDQFIITGDCTITISESSVGR